MDWITRMILLKALFRSDRLWGTRYAYTSLLKHIPLFLDTWALMRSQYWSRMVIRGYQDKRILKLLKSADSLPFWQNILKRAGYKRDSVPENVFKNLPITSKKDFVDRDPSEFIRASMLPKSDADHTSGSTGKPFHFYHDWHASLRSFAVTERIFRTATGGKRYPIVYMRAKERHGFTFYRHVWFYLRGYNSIQHRLEDVRALAARFPKGFVLYGYTSWVVELMRLMEEHKIVLPLRAVMVAGEHLLPNDRALIERVSKAELYTLYASREVGFLGFECERHAMHISEEWARIEIVNEKGEVLEPGKEGRIVVTVFDNEIMPFIRYDIGDVGRISDEMCPCGRTLRTLDFKGRSVELIELEDKRVVSLLDIAYVLGSFRDSVRQYRIIQTNPMSFVFVVVPGPTFHSNKEYLEPMMVRMLHPRVQILWEMVESIPEAQSGKAQYFVRDFNYRS